MVDYFAKLKPCREQGIIFYHGMMIEKELWMNEKKGD